MTSTRRILLGSLLASLTLGVSTCGGGGSSSPPPPSPGPTPPPGTPPASATITITAAGANPRDVTISVGGRVTFVNQDVVPHDMNSDPHPIHTDCPPMDAVAFLAAGQTKESAPFPVARTCGYHDHNQPTNTSLQGRIVIQ